MVQKRVISAGGVIFWKSESNILVCIVKRKGKNVWILPRGRVEMNENMEDTVVREVKEETGIVARVIRKLGVIKYNYYSPYDRLFYDKEVHFYLLKITKQERFIPNDEIQDMKWVTVQDALQILSYEKEKEILLKAVKYIS
ncbi:MAG: NUDIX hydrolase [Candidatus Calescibacterium sp.]|nr:NUDIX hydrolase [Candidatus Calescibacterium sp.]MDW8132032.1 NUDIX hydrolase [Candidatus Calescibacterium sp.]